ncbi:carbohydrate porin [Photobacterium sp. SDRW27]|uniref:carbohydrate porin n=1 Tax=Photobacterium obscurum TaxID=2829490 RepID=UPI002244C620|nr:carbohydrate porin [Photobacterium obscurum]MCW8331020.1 carbohydrate porin [Photobacterium obscurum]
MNHRLTKLCIIFSSLSIIPSALSSDLGGPGSVESKISQQPLSKASWREQLASDGFTFGLEYSSIGLTSPDGSLGNNVERASGLVQLYGEWNLLGNQSETFGGIVWKVGHRHGYTETPVSGITFSDDFTGGPEGLGYIGMIGSIYSDVGFLVTNLHWKQKFNGGRTSVKVGWQDVTDYVDTYALANPLDGFTNLAFSTGSGAMGIPDEGVLAISAGHMVTDNIYVIASLADANGKSKDIFDGFKTAFDESEFFTALELGWTVSQDQIYTDNVHITLWDFGENTRHSNATGEGGKGINFSASYFVTPQIMPFIRGGFSEGDVALYDKSISVGLGYFGLGKSTNNLGFAVNWAETNEVAFGSDEQYTTELYYNMQFGEHLQIAPDIQYIKDPAFSNESSAWVFGVRARIFI